MTSTPVPAFPHISSVARPASQPVPTLQTSSPISTPQEMIPNNENIQDMKPVVNNLTPSLRPVSAAAANVRILNDVAQARMLSNVISSGMASSVPPAQTVISSAAVTSNAGSLPIPATGQNSAPASFTSTASTGTVNPSVVLSQPMSNLQVSVGMGQPLPGMTQGNLPATQMVQQTGMSMNQKMMPTPGMSQQIQPGMQPVGVNGNNSVTNMPLNQQSSSTIQSAQSKYIKVWEVIIIIIKNEIGCW